MHQKFDLRNREVTPPFIFTALSLPLCYLFMDGVFVWKIKQGLDCGGGNEHQELRVEKETWSWAHVYENNTSMNRIWTYLCNSSNMLQWHCWKHHLQSGLWVFLPF